MKTRYFSTFQLILIALFAALIVVAKIALKTPMQLPGHTGLYWMAILVVISRVVPRPGSASLTGFTSGVLASFLGVGDYGALNTILSYSMAGVGVDATLLMLGSPENLVTATLAGIAGNLAKFLVKWGFGVISGAPLGFVALGLVRSLVSYFIFGALGGLLGGLTLIALRKAGFFAYLAEKK